MVLNEQIVNRNIWWRHGTGFESYDKDLSALFPAVLKFPHKPLLFQPGKIYTIRGPRRVGKTVWMKMMIRELLKDGRNPRQILYFACDDLPSRSREQLGRVISRYQEMAADISPTYLFLDEITYIIDWETELKSLVDAGRLTRSAVIVGGSSPSQIKRKAEYLPGRGVEGNEYILKPISFRDFVLAVSRDVEEILTTTGDLSPTLDQKSGVPMLGKSIHLGSLFTKDADELNSLGKLWKLVDAVPLTLEESPAELWKKCSELFPYLKVLRLLFNVYLLTGGFPHVINNYLRHLANNNRIIDDACYEEILRSVLGELGKAGKTEELAKQILNAVSRRMGSRYSFSALARDIPEGVSHPTVLDYIGLFGDSFIVQLLTSLDLEKGKESIKADKKIYPVDPFIVYALRSRLMGKPGFETTTEFLLNEGNQAAIVESLVITHLARIKEIPKMKEPSSFLWFAYTRKGKEIDAVYQRQDGKQIGIEVKYQYTSKRRAMLTHPALGSYIVLTRDTFDRQDNTLSIPAPLLLAGLVKSERNL